MAPASPRPGQCPVCGAQKIEARKLTNVLNGTQQPVRRYVCGNGHVFYVPADAKAADAAS